MQEQSSVLENPGGFHGRSVVARMSHVEPGLTAHDRVAGTERVGSSTHLRAGSKHAILMVRVQAQYRVRVAREDPIFRWRHDMAANAVDQPQTNAIGGSQ
jgi:hypothetical protein